MTTPFVPREDDPSKPPQSSSSPYTFNAQIASFLDKNIVNAGYNGNSSSAVYEDLDVLAKTMSQNIHEETFHNCSSNVITNPNVYTLTQQSGYAIRYPHLTDKNFFVSFVVDNTNTQTSIKIALAGWNSAISVDALNFGGGAFAVGDLPINTYCKFMFDANQQKFILVHKGQKSGNYTGELKHGQMFQADFDGWLLWRDGRQLNKATYPKLWAFIVANSLQNSFYQDINTTTFAMRNLSGRVVIASGSGSGLTTRTFAQLLGEELHLMTLAELVAHFHTFGVSYYNNTSSSPGSGNGNNQWTGSTNSAGSSQPFNVMQPSAVLNLFVYSL